MVSEPKDRKFPYRVVFPDSSEDPQNAKTLEDALHAASWRLNRVWKEDGPWGRAGEPTTDADRAVITNRNTGYRWITRARRAEVEFQTPRMFEDLVGEQGINIYLTIEEAEALARAAQPKAAPQDAHQKALTNQALDQIAHVCREARGRIESGLRELPHAYTGILHARPALPQPEKQDGQAEQEQEERTPRPPYRPLGDSDNLSLKEAGEILGKARNTIHGWYKKR